MTKVRRLSVFAMVGAIAGEIVATLVAPGMITWWNTPGSGATQMICDYPRAVRLTIDALVRAQLIGAGSGAALFLILGIFIMRWLALRARAKAAAAAAH